MPVPRRFLAALAAAAAALGVSPALAAGAPAPVTREWRGAPASFQYELSAGSSLTVTVPINGRITLPRGAGRHPVVLVMHGRHEWCTAVLSRRGGVWGCPKGQREVRSYIGYQYLLDALARRGFAVVSIDVNSATAVEDVGGFGLARLGTCTDPSFCRSLWNGMDFRARVADTVLRRLAAANAGTGPQEFTLGVQGRLDLSRVGLVGHSRGGEGVVTTSALFHRASAYRIRGVFVVSPVDFRGRIVPDDVAYGSVISYCDGDVSDQQGVNYFDDVSRRPGRTRPTFQVVALGANHNYFNRVWADEWYNRDTTAFCGPRAADTGRLSRARQERLLVGLVVPFMRREVAGADVSARPLGAGLVPPTRLAGVRVVTSYAPPAARRLRILGPGSVHRNLLGGRLAATGASRYIVCLPTKSCTPSTFVHGVAAYQLRWTGAGVALTTAIPARRGDVRGYGVLALRAAIDPPATLGPGCAASVGCARAVGPSDSNPQPIGVAQPLTIELRDRAGHHASITVPGTAPALAYPPGQGGGSQRAILGAIRVRLARFHGVDLRRLSTIALRFHTAAGSIFLSDLELQR